MRFSTTSGSRPAGIAGSRVRRPLPAGLPARRALPAAGLVLALLGYLAIAAGAPSAAAAPSASAGSVASSGVAGSGTASSAAASSATASASSTPTGASSAVPSSTAASSAAASSAVPGGTSAGPQRGNFAPASSNLTAAGKGANYLVQQLVDGEYLNSPYGPDYGLTADLALALAAAGGHDDTLAKVVGYLRAHVADYADPAGTGQFPGPYSGAVGKLAVLAEVTGQDPHAFGGFDLLASLTGHVCSAPDQAGACTAAGDFYQSFSTVSQALAVLALARGGVTPPAAAVSRLESLQCPGGGFSSPLLAVGDPCTPDPDTTGFALQALSLVPGASAEAGTATGYLLGAQQSDGGYLGAAGENTNSTALAVQGLLSSGNSSIAGAVAAAQGFLLGLQNSDGGFGVRASSPASDPRPSTAAVPALVGSTLVTLSDPVVPVSPTSTPPTSTAPTSTAPASSRPASATPSAPTGSSASSIEPVSGAGQSGGELASTGASTGRPLWLAVLLMLAGAMVLMLTRRTRRR